MTITGRSISSILSSRIVWAQTTYNGYVEKIMRRMVADAFIEPLILERAVSIMALGTELGIQDKAKMQFTVESVDSEVAPNHTYVLGRDYFIGDVVEIINEYGIAMTPRVVEVIECQDENGYTCIPTFATDD